MRVFYSYRSTTDTHTNKYGSRRRIVFSLYPPPCRRAFLERICRGAPSVVEFRFCRGIQVLSWSGYRIVYFPSLLHKTASTFCRGGLQDSVVEAPLCRGAEILSWRRGFSRGIHMSLCSHVFASREYVHVISTYPFKLLARTGLTCYSQSCRIENGRSIFY